ncbi:hypothetical protein M2152_001289 [Microbacteriaceae bacterium SG_E_30_P1]|uniref:DUF222 domain-containing protein n=1 Tax=Antiquaquibacter oligotrophicus TaxID=2880260 RepID=A0ABT6KPT6_9MICO|nr:HNH endonuclease signature motif containing protein [Antiquaquibacter oligotrophicus]MDH6181107.1 hypothetical protein [Antiquaquibacter oligotrophicus]UDF13195.1 HNH endonuclease [Antiquaquibacter oligotrophicus]
MPGSPTLDEAPILLDESLPDTRALFGMARAEFAQSAATRAHAELVAAIADTVREAREFPYAFVENLRSNDDAVEFATRAIVADLAVRLGLSEGTVRTYAHEADLLRVRAPQVWYWFREGECSIQNARTAAEQCANLPEEVWPAFDAAMADLRRLAPARFRSSAARTAARLSSADLTERHTLAAVGRRVWVDPAPDGMAWFNALLSAEEAARAYAIVDARARALASAPGESRTLAQLRADVMTDLVAGRLGDSRGASVTVAVTVPVMTLLGLDEAPATLDGVTPIEAETARRLSAHAPSFTRILTHPISGVVLDIDRGTYRVPADLARTIRALHPICDFSGCGRPASACDLDHTLPFGSRGPTSGANVGPLCRNHHRVRHHTTWLLERDASGLLWTSPTGHSTRGDPPPF